MRLCAKCGGPVSLSYRLCWKCHVEECEQAAYEKGFRDGQLVRAVKSAFSSMMGSSATQPDIDETRLRQLIQLCHPDKHGGSKVANEVTQWLLEMRQPQRKRA